MATIELGSGKPPKTGVTVRHGVNTVKHVDVASEGYNERLKQAGAFAWGLLHRYRGCDSQWLELWQYFIPSGSCSCKDGYSAILQTMPPDFTSPEAFFAWGVNLHNAVNQKLIDSGDTSKRIITLEEAYQIWRECDGEKCDSN